MGPDWRGVDWADSASPCPAASTIPAPKSSDSRMIDEYDIRMSLWPISVATFSSAPWMTLAVTGSTRRLARVAPPPFPSAGAWMAAAGFGDPPDGVAAADSVPLMGNPRWR